MTTNNLTICHTCGNEAHDFTKEEILECVPPKDVLKFGHYEINKEYREALFNEHPMYDVEEVVGTYLGKNKHFSSQSAWLEEQDENFDEEE